MFQYRQALVRMRRGDSDRELARGHYMGRRQLARLRDLAQSQGWLDPLTALPEDAVIAQAVGTPARASSTVSPLESQRERVQGWLEQGASGMAIFAALKREQGYAGSYSSVYRLVCSIRGAQPAQATVPLTFSPGEAAQVDFGAGPIFADESGAMRRTWAFVMTLCFSRHQYVEFVWDQSAITWQGCHRRAFEWFAGVPARIIIDNPKCAITRACIYDPLVQRAYAECAEGYGFKIDPCPPADPQKKGIVESGVKYVKRNLLALRSFRDLADLNAQAREWVLREAGVRIHGTTRKTPLGLFELEAAQLRSLPPIAPELGSWHRVSVHRDCHVAHARALYSVPFALVGKALWLRATDGAVAIFEDYRLVATHPRARRVGERLTVRDHLPPAAQAFFAQDRQWCETQAAAIGPACARLIAWLLTDHILERLRAAQGVIRLAKQFSPERLEIACARALTHESPYYRTVKTILAGGHDRADTESAAANEIHVPQARFARPAHSLFDPDANTRH